MTGWLEWGYAEPADVEGLRSFCCTLPKERSTVLPGRFVYPRPPEARAEKLVHELANLRKAERAGQRIWVGRDEQGIAAVACWQWIAADVVQVCVIALALRVRGHHGVYTEELVDTATAQVGGEATERGLTQVFIIASIHEDNRASRAFAARFGMEQVDEPDRHGYAIYSATLPFIALT